MINSLVDRLSSLKQKWVLGLLMALIVPTFFTLLRPGYFWMQDDLQAFRVLEMWKCFQDLQIPCRWVPDPGYQYGYPQFLFYPPSVYYLGALMHLIGTQVIDSVKLLFILGFVLSASFMYLFLNEWLGRWPAIVGALVYSYAPYKALEVYVRGALSEFWSFVFFPLVFWAIYRNCIDKSARNVAFLAVSVGGLLMTHNLMSLIFLPIALLWSVWWAILERNVKGFLFCLAGFALGVGLAAFFSLPVVFERQFAHVETLVGGYFDYRQHFVDIGRLFFSNHWGYGSSGLNQDNDLSLSVGVVQWGGSLLAVLVSVIFWKKNKKLSLSVALLAVLVLGVAFMIHQKSSLIWSALPFLEFLQFPWRFLSVVVFLEAVLSACGIYFVFKWRKSWGFWLGLVLVVASMVSTLLFFQPKEWYYISDKEKFSGVLWEKQLTISIFDYLPIYAKFPPTSKAPEFPEVLSGDVRFVEYKKGSDFQQGVFEVSEDARVRLPIFDYPGMTVWVDGRRVSHVNNDCTGQEFCLGLVTFDIEKGKKNVRVALENTAVRTVGDVVSVISLIIVIALLRRKNEKVA